MARVAGATRGHRSDRDERLDREERRADDGPVAPMAPIVLFVTDAGEIGLDAERWTAPLSLAREDLAVWFSAWSSDATLHARTHDLADLEAWARATPAADVASAEPPDEARLHAVAVISLFGGLATRAALQSIGVELAVVERVLAAGAVTEADGDLAVAAGWQTRVTDVERRVDEGTLVLVAQALEARDPGSLGEGARGCAPPARRSLRRRRSALRDGGDGRVRSGGAARAGRALGTRDRPEAGQRQASACGAQAAERALALGEADEALRWAREATSLASKDEAPRAALLLGRASVATGDLVAARATLRRSIGEVAHRLGSGRGDRRRAGRRRLPERRAGRRRAYRHRAGDARHVHPRASAREQRARQAAAGTRPVGRGRSSLRPRTRWRHRRRVTRRRRCGARLNRGIARLSKGSLERGAGALPGCARRRRTAGRSARLGLRARQPGGRRRLAS